MLVGVAVGSDLMMMVGVVVVLRLMALPSALVMEVLCPVCIVVLFAAAVAAMCVVVFLVVACALVFVVVGVSSSLSALCAVRLRLGPEHHLGLRHRNGLHEVQLGLRGRQRLLRHSCSPRLHHGGLQSLSVGFGM